MDDSGYDLDDPKHPDWHSIHADIWDQREKLEELGVFILTIPPLTDDEKLKLQGWREGIEKYGQELWRIYHWIVWAQHGRTSGVYRLRQWLESFNVPANTGGEHWEIRDEG
jgi:hypothetical protein